MFSGNRKVRSSRPKSARELKKEVSPQTKSRQLDKRADEVSSEIHRLECYITAAPRIQHQHRLANVNMVPAMDKAAPRRRRTPIAQQRARRGERMRLCLEALIVVGSIAAVVGWLNQWFHFWN